MKSQRELIDSVIDALQELDANSPEADDLAPFLYTPDPRLKLHIKDLMTTTSHSTLTREQRNDAGRIMEQVALLSFGSLEGVTVIKSYQSAGPQHDLLVSGDTLRWLTLTRYLNLPESQRGIVVEAKAIKNKLEDKQFARLCAVIDTNLATVGLGVFLTLSGASGFPAPSQQRQRAIRDCRLRQALYHAKHGKAIVVFDRDDIAELASNGSLPRILARKIRDISELSGLATTRSEYATEVDLPDHLLKLTDNK